MATIWSSTGKHAEKRADLSLSEIESRLVANGYDTTADGIAHIPTDHPPQLQPVTRWADYIFVQAYDSEPKTGLFAQSGFYRLRKLSADNAGFLLIPKE